MQIMLNGSPKNIGAGLNVREFLAEHGYGEKLVAVAINGAFVPKSAHSNTVLQSDDAVEIVAPMQGG